MVFLIAVSLGMDACAVAVSSGMSARRFGKRQALWLGLYFGAFQFMMTLAGYFMGRHFQSHAGHIGGYIAFVLLATLGGKMVWEALHPDGGEEQPGQDLTHGRMALLAVATSIDALAAGVSFAFLPIHILPACTVIGAVALVMTVGGGLFGRTLSAVFQQRAMLLGGVVLIILAVRSLF